MLVIPAVALAAVLSYAVLANVGTQNQITANSQLLAQADCSAESGINYAMYQLQQSVTSQNLPPTIAFTGVPVQLGNLQESFTVSSTETSGANPVVYTITSTGTVTIAGGGVNPIVRKMMVQVQIPLTTSTQSQGGGLHSSGHHNGGVNGGINQGSGGTPAPEVPKNVQAMSWSQ